MEVYEHIPKVFYCEDPETDVLDALMKHSKRQLAEHAVLCYREIKQKEFELALVARELSELTHTCWPGNAHEQISTQLRDIERKLKQTVTDRRYALDWLRVQLAGVCAMLDAVCDEHTNHTERRIIERHASEMIRRIFDKCKQDWPQPSGFGERDSDIPF